MNHFVGLIEFFFCSRTFWQCIHTTRLQTGAVEAHTSTWL